MNAVSSRLASVDALRGLCVAAMLLVNNPGDWGHVYAPLQHAVWHGWTPTDFVFPFFLFIVGVSLALALGARIERGQSTGLLRTVWGRGLRILLLGLALHALAWWLMDKPALRLPGVLQRIGLCFALAGSLVIGWRARGQWAWIAVLLLGYGALLLGGGMAPEYNPASRLDAWLFGPHAYQWDAASGRGHDPEGLLASLGALATTLLGWRCGEALRQSALRTLLALGVGLTLAGWALDAAGLMPINKNLWTPSFVLFTAGLAALTLAALHQLIDRQGWPPLGRAFGVNAIAAYAGAWVCTVLLEGLGWMQPLYAAGFGWLQRAAGPEAASLSFALAFVAVWALIVRVLDQRRIYFKV
ncbi:MAG: heparan-alpha-glucosaminide N-acetyltransferase domain-containing protein [Inhella sp.]